MLVVADSSPINILLRIGCVDVLPRLFSSVIIPPEVLQELTDPRTPEMVRLFMASPPAWLTVRPAAAIERIPPLNPGEEAAISLARDAHADALLIDDWDGRRAAIQRGLTVIGTLGVLERAGEIGLIALPEIAARLAATDFRITPHLLQEAVERDQQRRKKRPGDHGSCTPPT